MDRRGLRPPHDVERYRLMGIAADTANFEIDETGIEGVAERRRWLRRTAIAEHTRVPRFGGEPVGFLARLLGPFSRGRDRTAVNGLA